MSQPKVAIIGLGLIGSSIGLALRKAGPDFKIVGHDKDSSVSKKALKLGAVEKWDGNLISTVEEAELVIITTPVVSVKQILEATGPYLKPDCVVTDTSTVKGEVLRWADELLPDTVHFIGGHPTVGTDETEPDAATPDLFAGSTYCLVPSPKAHPAAIELVTSMVRTLGAEPFFLDVAEHDGQVAGLEHLPLMLATALLMTATQAPSWRDLRRLPGPVFWRATQFPSTDPATNRDICLANRENIGRWIDLYVDNLRELQQKLAAVDGEVWEELFTELMDTRSRWLEGRRTPEEEGARAELDELRGTRTLGSMLGLTQFRNLRKKLDQRESK
ncbi:MAG: prephenate dehydrogenase [Chloroflexi bacterium B3_Chlor]|nr:MAG: prephenate dehydrogenase [Chloroflexi bacterium B3_Chlor]